MTVLARSRKVRRAALGRCVAAASVVAAAGCATVLDLEEVHFASEDADASIDAHTDVSQQVDASIDDASPDADCPAPTIRTLVLGATDVLAIEADSTGIYYLDIRGSAAGLRRLVPPIPDASGYTGELDYAYYPFNNASAFALAPDHVVWATPPPRTLRAWRKSGDAGQSVSETVLPLMATTGDTVYYATSAGVVSRSLSALTNPTLRRVVRAVADPIVGLATNRTHVFYATSTALGGCPHDIDCASAADAGGDASSSGAFELLGLPRAELVAADDDAVYWFDGVEQSIHRLSAPFSTKTTVAQGQSGAASIAVGPTRVYWARGNAIHYARKDGTCASSFTPCANAAGALFALGDYLFFGCSGADAFRAEISR